MANVTVTSRPSIRQVAEIAGVSRMTVSRVLNDRNGSAVAEETRRRVLQAVRELEYVPVAQPTRQNRHIETRIIGLVFDGTAFEGLWGLPTFLGLREAALQHGYDLLTILRQPPEWALDKTELYFLDRRTDGLIFIVPRGRNQVFRALRREKIPVVSCFIDDVPRGVPSVTVDNFGAMQLATQHLIDRGHRRILHLTIAAARSDFAERINGYETTMRAAKLKPLVLSGNDFSNQSFATQFLQTIRRHRISALACASDGLALSAWDFAAAQNIKIPEELSLVGMDNLNQGAERGLSSIRFSCEEIGRRAFEAVLQRIGGGEAPIKNSVVPVELVERASVASPI
jgi:LacI family transcriptional regulator